MADTKADISAKTALYGLLGNPVGHSMSPFMQNRFMESIGVDGVYLAFAVDGEKIGDVMRGMHAMGVQGVNVTIPHKEAVMSYLCGMSKAAEACGAVNTLIYTSDGYYGDNTDGAGLLAALKAKNGWQPEGKRVLIIGAGGAAKGVAAAMALAGIEELCIANRTVQKAEALAVQIAGLNDTKTAAISMEELADGGLYKHYDTIVHTTSLGMSPHVDAMAPVNMHAITGKHLVVDLIYNPMETKLLRLAKAQGAQTASGLGMFLYQGVLAFEKWTGRMPEQVEAVERELIARLTDERK